MALKDAVDKVKYPPDHPIIKRMVYMKKMVSLFSDSKPEKKPVKQSSSVSKQTDERPWQAKNSLHLIKPQSIEVPQQLSLPHINSTKAVDRSSFNSVLSASVATP